jgi:hypothetical protein
MKAAQQKVAHSYRFAPGRTRGRRRRTFRGWRRPLREQRRALSRQWCAVAAAVDLI